MASYRDYLDGKESITDKRSLSKAVSTLSAVANKRLKRIQAKLGGPIQGEFIAGVQKFGAKGKTEQQLNTEFKRLKSFFTSGLSSLTEIKQQAKEFQTRVTTIEEWQNLRAAKMTYEETMAEIDRELERKRKEEEIQIKEHGEEYKKFKYQNKKHFKLDNKGDYFREFYKAIRFYDEMVANGDFMAFSTRERYSAKRVAYEVTSMMELQTYEERVREFDKIMKAKGYIPDYEEPEIPDFDENGNPLTPEAVFVYGPNGWNEVEM